tara:strand:+ start:342 stop:545 length:204 start_codon:yes stop_codon:yes gene_type:complete
MKNVCEDEDFVSLNEEINFDKFMSDIIDREKESKLLKENKQKNSQSLLQQHNQRYMELPQNRMVWKK